MAQVTLNPSKDVHLTKTVPTVNQDSASLDVGEYNGNVGDIRRALLHFDLSSIPSGSTITVATFRIYDSGDNLATNTRTMRAYRLLRAWGETTATWNTTDGSTSWGTVGAYNTTNDLEATDIGSVSMPGTEVAGYVDITLTASKVQEWLNGTLANNGLLLGMDTELDDLHRFNSDEGANKPELVITYTPPILTKSIIKLQAVNRASTY